VAKDERRNGVLTMFHGAGLDRATVPCIWIEAAGLVRRSLRGVRDREPLARRAAPVVPPVNNRSGAPLRGRRAEVRRERKSRPLRSG